ncbi:MAG: VOC family protein [Vicinamibacterales bacterium]
MATTLNPYVTLNGNCAEAVAFWTAALGATSQVMRMGDSPMPVPPEAKDRVMHATIKTDALTLMASDAMMGQSPSGGGGSVAISLNFTDKDEQTRVWDRLSAGGTPVMPLGDQFWGRFGMLVDRFGVQWMLNYEAPRG